MPELISSPQNPKIKNLKKLEKASERREQNLFVIEGLREAVLAQRAGYKFEALFVCPELFKQDSGYSLEEITKANHELVVFEITKTVYDSLAYRETTEGVIATAKIHSKTISNLILKENPLLLVIESVEKPGNLGAMLRTCDAAGIDAVIICDPKTEIHNPNVIRSSMGTVFTNQIAVADTEQSISFLKQKRIKTYAADLGATTTHYDADYSEPTAIVVGAEATGLSKQWIKACDERVKIPMKGKIDSLNVSVSAAILIFEATRQRENI